MMWKSKSSRRLEGVGWKLAFLASLNPRDPLEKPERRELVRLGRARAFVLLGGPGRREDVSGRRKGQAHQQGARRGASGHRRGNSRLACPFCQSMFRDALPAVSEKPPKLMDIAQIVAAAIRG